MAYLTDVEILEAANRIKNRRTAETTLSDFRNKAKALMIRWSIDYDRSAPNKPSNYSIEIPKELVEEFISNHYQKIINANPTYKN